MATYLGIPDEIYDIVSVLYHALQGAKTYQQSVKDAEQRADQKLAQFFSRRTGGGNAAGAAVPSLAPRPLSERSGSAG